MEGVTVEAWVTPLCLFFPPLWWAFYFFLIMLFNWCIAQGSKIVLYDVAFVLPLRMRQFLVHQGWDMQGFRLKRWSSKCSRTRWLLMGGIELMLGFFPCANLCPSHLLHFDFFSFIVAILNFFILLAASTSMVMFSSPTPVCEYVSAKSQWTNDSLPK